LELRLLNSPHGKRWELDDEELTEAFESLPEEEQRRLAAEASKRLVANNEKMRLEAEELRQQVKELELTLTHQQALLERLHSEKADCDASVKVW